MLTKDDKKYISTEVATQITKALNKNNDVLVKDMLDLFTVTNERIDKLDEKISNRIDNVNKNLSDKIDDTNERIDKVFDHLRNDFDSIENLEKRTGKLEEKVFTISA